MLFASVAWPFADGSVVVLPPLFGFLLTELSAWLVSLGIKLIRSRPGKPQDNGGHERMHRDMGELELAPARSRHAQQHDCDRWLIDFNNVRPHDALGGKTPAEVYKPCHRPAVVRRWDWHRLWGLLPVFPRVCARMLKTAAIMIRSLSTTYGWWN